MNQQDVDRMMAELTEAVRLKDEKATLKVAIELGATLLKAVIRIAEALERKT